MIATLNYQREEQNGNVVIKWSKIAGNNKSINHESHHDEKQEKQLDSQVAKQGKNDGMYDRDQEMRSLHTRELTQI